MDFQEQTSLKFQLKYAICWAFCTGLSVLTPCSLVRSYGISELGPHYTPYFNKVERGVYCFGLICPSVRPSVDGITSSQISVSSQYPPNTFFCIILLTNFRRCMPCIECVFLHKIKIFAIFFLLKVIGPNIWPWPMTMTLTYDSTHDFDLGLCIFLYPPLQRSWKGGILVLLYPPPPPPPPFNEASMC